MKKTYLIPNIISKSFETENGIMEASLRFYTDENEEITKSEEVLTNKNSIWGEE